MNNVIITSVIEIKNKKSNLLVDEGHKTRIKRRRVHVADLVREVQVGLRFLGKHGLTGLHESRLNVSIKVALLQLNISEVLIN